MVSVQSVATKRKVRGVIRAINLERNTCLIKTAKGKLLPCCYDEQFELEVKDALDLEVEAIVLPLAHENGNARRVRWLKIEKIDIVDEFDIPTEGSKHGTVQDFLNSEIIGMWKDRDDLDDDFIRTLRS